MPGDQSFIPENKALKAAADTSVGLVVILLLLSVVFFKERMLFIDAPHNLFRIINDGHFHIEEHRYGSFISQIFPLAGAQLHLPLQALMILYSASFNLFFLGVALLLVYKFRNYGLAILFALYLTLFASATFYWPNNEVHQGIGWLVLAFAFNSFMAEKKWPFLLSLPVFAASFYLAIWTHPLVMLIAVYLWFFFWLANINWPYSKARSFVCTVILLLLAYFKFNVGMHHGYDSSKIEMITHFDPRKIRYVFNAPQLHYFAYQCVTNYWILVLLFVAGIIGLIKERRFLLLALTLLFATGYLLLVCITFWDYPSTGFYIESEYMPLSVICCAPFVYFLLPKLTITRGVAALAFIFCIRLAYILHAAPAFTNRVALLEKINDKMKEKKLAKIIIPLPVQGIDSALILDWGAPAESMFLSGLKHQIPQRTFIFLSPDDMKAFNTASKDTLLGCWIKWPSDQLNSYYFQMDTNSNYRTISYTSLMQ